jgi:elongation factor Ts
MTNAQSDTQTIVKLREKTGAGMMDCKKALTEAGGDYDKAVEVLRKKGMADAAKRSARVTKEGLVSAHITPDGKKAAIAELQCETDFVAKTDEFQALSKALVQEAAEGKIASVEAVAERVKGLSGKIGENVVFARFDRYELKNPGLLAFYVHSSGSKKGALIELKAATDAAAQHEAVQGLAKELAMQIVAMGPRWVKAEDVPAEIVAKEKEIAEAQVRKENKPEAQIPKIVEGKVRKLFFGTACLVEQPSMRDNKTPIRQLVDEAAKKAGGAVEVVRFSRFQLGGD